VTCPSTMKTSRWSGDLLLDILHDQADVGLTAVNSDLILAWSRYQEGQHHLADILKDVRQKTLDVLRDALATKYRRTRDRDNLTGLHFFGAVEAVPVKLQKGVVWTGFRVPADINRPAVSLKLSQPTTGGRHSQWRSALGRRHNVSTTANLNCSEQPASSPSEAFKALLRLRAGLVDRV
jgi:hypothetical protein